MESSIRLGFCILVTILFLGCQKKDKLDFFNVSLNSIEPPTELGSLTLLGNVSNASNNFSEISRVGIIVSTEVNDVENNLMNARWLLADDFENGVFSVKIEDLSHDSLYFFKAFAESINNELGMRLVYSSELELFSFQVRLNIEDGVEIRNDNAVLVGAFSGLEANNINVVNHGFMYSSDFNFANSETDTTFLNGNNDDGFFKDTITELSFNTSYYYKAWAEKANGELFFSNVDSFWVRDGWRQVTGLNFGIAKSSATSYQNTGLVAFGLVETETYFDYTIKFNPSSNEGLGTWIDLESFPFGFGNTRYDGMGVKLGSNYYVGLGEYTDEEGEIKFHSQIFIYDLSEGNWQFGQSYTFPSEVSSTVAFALDGDAFIGTGTITKEDDSLLNEFWMFQPDSVNHWRLIAPLPFKAGDLDEEEFALGRFQAVSFVHNDIAYVGGGYVEGVGISNDFWKFIPPNEKHPDGAWEAIAPFPGPARYLAVAMVQKGRIYYGMGDSFYNGELSDWWEYIPEDDVWIERTPLPAKGRSDAITMAIGPLGQERGFLGGGTTREASGTDIVKTYLSDFWEYIPTEE